MYNDLLDVNKGVIIHQVNCRRVMGAGIAKALRAKYPQHYTDYMAVACPNMLGNIVCTKVDKHFGIIGMFAQLNYGRQEKQTSYSAFKECLIKISTLHAKNPNVQYYMPYGIGCGLAGGDWRIVSQMITEICPFIILIKKPC